MNVLDNFRLDGRVIIITGGAGMLGSEYAQSIQEAGGIPIIADVDEKKAKNRALELSNNRDEKAFGLFVDVSNKDSVQQMVQQVVQAYGRIDGLINNAALDPKFEGVLAKKHTTSFEDFPQELWDQSLAVNLTGMFLCAQAVAPTMLAQGYGSIVNVASTYGLVGPDQRIYQSTDPKAPTSFKPVAYSVSKSGVTGLTRYLATYWAGKNIRVNTLTPGGVYNGHEKEFEKNYSYRTTLGRMARKDEYNGAIVFLLSNASSYMTGSNLVIDGGWTAW